MKKVEIESLVKSFLLFFISQLLFLGALFWLDYKKELQSLDESIFSQMRICSFDLQCEEYKIDFAPVDSHELYKLYKSDMSVSSYFSIPGATKNVLKIYLPTKEYLAKINTIKRSFAFKYGSVVFIIFLLSLLFSFYTLSPLRNALKLTEEFIKDILHDFNTPLATLRLNSAMLKEEIGENSKINRMEKSIQNILSLQSNLRSYLADHTTQNESFNLKAMLEERVKLIDNNYRDIHFTIEVPKIEVKTNLESFKRIIDNLLSNAAKYNIRDGSVTLSYAKGILSIEDSGKGIRNTKKIFDRFYKEQDRGIGIGLHIVKRLCDDLEINIRVESELQRGSTFFLDLQKLLIDNKKL